MDENKEIKRPRSLFFPLLLVIVGVFLLLTNLHYIKSTAWDLVRTYWPLIFIAGGLDGLYRREGWAGPLVGIGLGTVLILGNLGYLAWGGWNLLWRLWPVLIIAWGLDVAFGRNRSLWSTVARVALGLLLVGGILWLAMASPLNTGFKTESISQQLSTASPSNISLQQPVGELTLTGNAAEDMLITGTVVLPKGMTLLTDYSHPAEAADFYALKPSGVVVNSTSSNQSPWAFKINSTHIIFLNTEVAVGSMVLDLADTQVQEVDSQMAVGQTVITFPAKTNVTGDIEGAVGETILRFPKGSSVTIHFSGGLTSVQLDDGFSRTDDEITSDFSGDYSIELDVDQAVGSLVIQWY